MEFSIGVPKSPTHHPLMKNLFFFGILVKEGFQKKLVEFSIEDPFFGILP